MRLYELLATLINSGRFSPISELTLILVGSLTEGLTDSAIIANWILVYALLLLGKWEIFPVRVK